MEGAGLGEDLVSQREKGQVNESPSPSFIIFFLGACVTNSVIMYFGPNRVLNIAFGLFSD